MRGAGGKGDAAVQAVGGVRSEVSEGEQMVMRAVLPEEQRGRFSEFGPVAVGEWWR